MTVATHYKERRDGLWKKCAHCNEPVFKPALERNFYACPYCDYYSSIPAEMRLRYLFDSQPSINLYPPLTPKPFLKSLELIDVVSRTTFPDGPYQLMAAGEGTISGYPAILAVVHPYSVPQRVHFVTLLTAILTALHKKYPLITVYPSDVLFRRKSDKQTQSELLPSEITYLTIEMDGLSQERLPQITILTDADETVGFSTRFPLGDLVFAEHGTAHGNRSETHPDKRMQNSDVSDCPQSDVLIDCYCQRQELPAKLGKLLAFFAR